ncbi:hypothetical protein K488DRAFT_55175 [Vararia minispora EC-137]|uniref:Uncharacterized protein n=1 Tax=Vararia minispora EC-137 TaxID=1314806 RepID=A0ACB8QEG2_9AGAM|nr:hypothetical protein K488DRAFT_55175 [Vararia minispora EC-137]
MSQPETLTFDTLTSLASPKSAYVLTYSFLFGMSFWVTFFGGVIAFRALPRQMFGALQHRTFPVYFNMTIALSAPLAAYWTYTHPAVLEHYLNPRVADVAQAYALGVVFLSQALNAFVIGPLTSKTMFKRHKLEKKEGKQYNEPGVSDEMKALNRTFGQLHGWSSLLNLGVVIALGFHGLWIGTYGI